MIGLERAPNWWFLVTDVKKLTFQLLFIYVYNPESTLENESSGDPRLL